MGCPTRSFSDKPEAWQHETAMKTLIVLAHPLQKSLCHHLAQKAATKARSLGHDVRVLDLYEMGFDPRLSVAERSDYYTKSFADDAGLQDTEMLILVFPTWWFSLPAILKGWIDRSFLPGVAYDHASDLSALSPRLHNLRHLLVVTTLGSPGWVDRLILRRPLHRALKWGLAKACAPRAKYSQLSLYQAEAAAAPQVGAFVSKLEKRLEKLT